MSTPMIAAGIATGDARRQQQVHDQTIELLVKETHVDIERVRALYEAEHARLAAEAKIKTYVPVIAARLVRTALYSRAHAQIQ
jgi:hypothetical protein